MSFRITGLSPEPFQSLYGLTDDALAARGVVRLPVDECPGFPDRVTLEDAPRGTHVLLLNHTHQPAATPFHASHAIFVLEGAETRYDRVDDVPEVLRRRVISLRAFDEGHAMVDAALAEGTDLEPAIERLLSDERVSYIQAHYATRGCYAAEISRA